MLIKTNEATGAVLDWLVSQAVKPQYKDPSWFGITTFGPLFGKGYRYPCYGTMKFSPSTDWSQGGPIIERERIKLSPTVHGKTWTAQFRHTESHPLVAHPVLAGWTNQHGPTPLIAAMRCFVASKLGDEVEVPEELL